MVRREGADYATANYKALAATQNERAKDMKIDVNDLLQWEAVIVQLARLGVTGWHAVQALLEDAGADEETIALLAPKWDALVDDVRRAAGQSPD